MWGLINTSQLVFYIPLMQVSLPPNALYLFQFLAFFNGDLYILVKLYELSVGLIFDTSTGGRASPSHFASMDMESTLLLSNAGLLLTVYSVILFLILLTFFLKRCLRHRSLNSKSSRCIHRMRKCLSWNLILRLLIESYLEIGLCSLLNLINVSPPPPHSRSHSGAAVLQGRYRLCLQSSSLSSVFFFPSWRFT